MNRNQVEHTPADKPRAEDHDLTNKKLLAAVRAHRRRPRHRLHRYAAAIVVTVPEEPRHFSAPDWEYSTPPPLGLVLGTVVALARPITPSPVPNARVMLPNWKLFRCAEPSVFVVLAGPSNSSGMYFTPAPLYEPPLTW